MIDLFFLILGLVVLISGGEFLVRGASNIALRLKISPLVVGLTIVAFGTSAPELLISVKSVLSGIDDLAMGNVVGSNICNLGLVLGFTAVVSDIYIERNTLRFDWPMTFFASILMLFVSSELLWNNRIIEFWEGLLFFSMLIAFTSFSMIKSRKDTKAKEALMEEHELTEPEQSTRALLIDILMIAIGCAGLFYGAEWFVEGAEKIALRLGVSERVIGITLVALGTSLPELVTSAIAAYKKQTDLALGNLLGSNIFNILSILGITSMIQNITIDPVILEYDMIWMMGITVLVLILALIRKKLGRVEGVVLLLFYVVYTYSVIN
ncbi:calcium/sodium antiporter [Hyphobacterium sp. CCMP332]|nr:calcium/sodium antiporter [Hyphobacterium sp. CCMP332]